MMLFFCLKFVYLKSAWHYNANLTKQTVDAMKRSDVINAIAARFPHLPANKIEDAAITIIEKMSQNLEKGNRIEIRGFGSFNLIDRKAGIRRNPKTGTKVEVESATKVRFKAGKEMRERVNKSVNG